MNQRNSTPDQWCMKMCARLLVTATQCHGIVVVRTFAGGAPILASAIDAAALDKVVGTMLGTVPGNDTVLVITRTPDHAASTAETLMRFAQDDVGATSATSEDACSQQGCSRTRSREVTTFNCKRHVRPNRWHGCTAPVGTGSLARPRSHCAISAATDPPNVATGVMDGVAVGGLREGRDSRETDRTMLDLVS